MDNERKDLPTPENENWLDDILGSAPVSEEIGPDEQAIASVKLTHPNDLELERILAEDWDSVPDPELPVEQTHPEQPELPAEQIPPEALELENIMAENWDTEPETEQAADPAQQADPGALELENILAENWDAEPVVEAQPAAEDQPLDQKTQLFTAPEGDQPQAAQLETSEEQKKQVIEPQETPESTPSRHKQRANRKGRPKMKKGYGLFGIPHVVATAIWLLIIVAVGVSLGRVLWVCCADLMAFGKTPQEITITITDDDDIKAISEKLDTAGLIRYPGLFQKFAELTGKYENISVGTFTLSPHLDYNAMINAMGARAPAREEVEIMFPEGYTCEQIFDLLEEKNVCTVEELEAYAATGELDEYWFMEGVTRGDKYCLEGYLFPDTYKFYTNDEPRRVLEKFLNAFDHRYTDLMKGKLEPLNERLASVLASRGYDEAFIEENKITIREIVIIASMIEKETANDEESYTISSVIYNRLTNPGNYPFLNIDATLYYALNGNIDPVTGERKPLTQTDLEMVHPYNTYTSKGLPPGPISNPGRNSLDAALDPVETSYYYYVYNPHDAEHLFAKTEQGHEDNIDYIKSLDD